MCDLSENGGEDVRDPAHAGKQVILKTQGSNATWAPGNFGFLESGYGSGASSLERALADINAPGCTGDLITTEPGNVANKGKDGLNARFNGSRHPFPASNNMSYGRDNVTVESTESDDNEGGGNDITVPLSDTDQRIGTGDWDIDGYWSTNHGGASLPSSLSGGSRFQVYLYELGETYARKGKQTEYPAPSTTPSGWTKVIPPGPSVPSDGRPQKLPAPNGADRRVLEVVILECTAQDVKGRGDYEPRGFVEMFMTEPVDDPGDTTLYGEIIREITPSNSTKYQGNASLIY